MTADELANFVLECLESMPQYDREHFFRRLSDEYCTGLDGCGKKCGDCDCKWPMCQ